ncbi:MAG: hypothetical protein A2744_04670 [Candidatus Buchananbacteria bacterium RIFCSPHIGHO2_01_FULL_44_11]|uniref:HMA domain-containing protein n=1 Tax=Candidatus Buchananbacteria bacterium RIFCSPHIGHO2_01_FULL_44_11 TaxID=1797535 RepID=A0A1G1Y3W6_9BACT|nr:MAG: hypothetical protein A2744_04670 [Candidatus Buchananbacteria bacterium RIFCSPHIGHO2_01_FULL_44_11]
MLKLILPIRGMHCKSCELLIEEHLKSIPNIKKVHVRHQTGRAEVYYQGDEPSPESLNQAVTAAGYAIGDKDKLPWVSRNAQDYQYLVIAALILFGLYLLASRLGLLNLSINANNNFGLLVALVVGLVAGISTCMALIGGLVLGIAARHADLHPEASAAEKFRPHLFFNLGRILGFAVLGGLIGLVGSALQPSNNFLGIMTMFVGAVMIFLGLKLIEIFPILKDKSITLPKSISKLLGIHRDDREYSHKGAFWAGALTFFLPCGFTQAMQLYAVSTGSFLSGALIMSLFALGTAPGLLGIAGLTSVLNGKKAKLFFMTAGLAVIFLGWFNVSNASNIIHFHLQTPGNAAGNAVTNNQAQEVRMNQDASGYKPNYFTVKKGQLVRWIINSTNPYTCASSLVVPSYGISRSLTKGENVIEFTPTQAGEIPFSCSMGMYRGKFVVVD